VGTAEKQGADDAIQGWLEISAVTGGVNGVAEVMCASKGLLFTGRRHGLYFGIVELEHPIQDSISCVDRSAIYISNLKMKMTRDF
jgi:hypothetical protein